MTSADTEQNEAPQLTENSRPSADAHPNVDAPRGFGAIDYAVAVAMILLWGFNIIAMKIVVDAAGAFPTAFLRQFMVAIICLPFIRIVPGRMAAILSLGVISGGFFYLSISLSLAVADNVSALAIASQLGVPFSLILAVIFLKEKIGWPRMTGILLALSGVVLLVFDPEAGKELLGLAFSALASLLWAIATLIQRKTGGIGILNISGWMGIMGCVTLLPVAMVFDPEGMANITHLPMPVYGWTAYAAIGSSICGHGALVWLLQRHDVSVVSPLTIPTPVVSVAFAAWWFHTPITWLMALGGLIAMGGVTIVAIRNAQKARQQAKARLYNEAGRS